MPLIHHQAAFSRKSPAVVGSGIISAPNAFIQPSSCRCNSVSSYGTGTLPTGSAFCTEAFSVGEPIKIGKVKIHDRDFIIADNDGQVIIPNVTIYEVLEKVVEIDTGDKGGRADALTRIAGFHNDSLDEIVARYGGHL